ncbi:MAG: GAF domain-containing protein, partial [Ktedonobacteraceae bacterium]
LVVQRKTWPLTIKATVLNTIRRLLKPLYESAQEFSPYLRQGSQALLFPTTSFNSSTGPSEELLYGLANMIIRLGNIDHQARWRFCCILLPDILPNNLIMPMPQRRLVIRAQSHQSPHAIGTTISPDKSIMSLSHRAYLSGQITYRPSISKEDYTIALREAEGEIGSAIAVPIAREDGLAIGVIYAASHKHETDAFSVDDQRILRIIGQMVGELLMSFQDGQLAAAKLKNMIEKPTVVDEVLGTFLPEHMFIRRLESLLAGIQSTMPKAETEIGKKELSIISIDIDSQSSITNMYGDRVVRNLSLELGKRIYSQLRLLFSESSEWRFYYIYGGRFYIVLDGVSLDTARTKARQLQLALSGEYKVDALRVTRDQVTSPYDMLKLSSISVRLGVTSYPYWKLAELLGRYPSMHSVTSVIGFLLRFLDIALSEGKPGGIMAWDREKWALVQWS